MRMGLKREYMMNTTDDYRIRHTTRPGQVRWGVTFLVSDSSARSCTVPA